MVAQERTIIAESAAASLGAMMSYKRSQQDETRLAILTKAIEAVGPLRGDGDVALDDLIQILADEDPEE